MSESNRPPERHDDRFELVRAELAELHGLVSRGFANQDARFDAIDSRFDVVTREQDRLRGDTGGWMEKILLALQSAADDARVAMWRAEAVASRDEAIRHELSILQSQMVAMRERITALEGKAA